MARPNIQRNLPGKTLVPIFFNVSLQSFTKCYERWFLKSFDWFLYDEKVTSEDLLMRHCKIAKFF